MSAPSLEHTPYSTETLDQLPQSELLNRREQVDAQIDDLESNISEYLAGLQEKNDPQLASIEQLEDEEQSDTSLPEARSAYTYMIERGEGILSPDLLALFKEAETLDKTEEKILDQLDARFAPGLMRYARDEAMELIANIDYVAVGKLKKGSSPDLPDSDGIRLRDFEQTLPRPDTVVARLHNIAYDEPENLNYRYAELQVDEVERCKEILDRWGVGSKKPWPKSAYDHTELERAEELNNRYRNYHNQLSALAAESLPLLPMHEWAVDLPDTEVTKFYEHLASIEIEKELERIAVEGTELLPFEFTDTELRDYIRTHIPAIALEGLDKIIFRKTNEEEKKHHDSSNIFDGKGVTLAHHAHSLTSNSAEIVIFVDKFQKSHDDLTSKDPEKVFVDWVVKNQVFDTVAHELGHALHHTLPVSILHEWDEVAASENVEVTNYVAEMNRLDNRYRFMEDFADSFSLYTNDPRGLSTLAYKRYIKMDELVTKLKPAA